MLSDYEKIVKGMDKVNDKIVLAREDIAALKIKSGVWGLMGGLIPVALTLIIYSVFKWSQ